MYSVIIYSSPIYIPLSFAVHTWVEINSPDHGPERFEIHAVINKKTGNYFYLNSKKSGEGMSLFALPDIWYGKKYFNSKVLYKDEGMQAQDTVLKIHNMVNNYMHKNKYITFPGPNSNTFAQWVIDSFLNDKNIKLPFNAFGKNFMKN